MVSKFRLLRKNAKHDERAPRKARNCAPHITRQISAALQKGFGASSSSIPLSSCGKESGSKSIRESLVS